MRFGSGLGIQTEWPTIVRYGLNCMIGFNFDTKKLKIVYYWIRKKNVNESSMCSFLSLKIQQTKNKNEHNFITKWYVRQ